MDAFDFVDDEPKKPRSNIGGLIWKIGTAYFLIGALCMGAFFAYTFLYPQNPLNPFPPAPGIPTNTPIPPSTEPPPTDTPIVPTATGTTSTEGPTLGPLPTATPFVTSDITPTTGSTGLKHFTVQEGTPLYLPYSGGCGGLYIAGNVVDNAGNPLVFMLVRVGGTLGGETLQLEDALSGSNPNYSSSGWEVKIADAPIDSTGTVFVELYALESEDPVSDLIIVDTFNDCNQNLIMVNFVQDE